MPRKTEEPSVQHSQPGREEDTEDPLDHMRREFGNDGQFMAGSPVGWRYRHSPMWEPEFFGNRLGFPHHSGFPPQFDLRRDFHDPSDYEEEQPFPRSLSPSSSQKRGGRNIQENDEHQGHTIPIRIVRDEGPAGTATNRRDSRSPRMERARSADPLPAKYIRSSESLAPPPPPPPRRSSQPTKDNLHPAPQIVLHIPITVEGRNNDPAQNATNESVAEPTTPSGPPPGPIPMGCSESLLNVCAAINGTDKEPLPAPIGPIPTSCSQENKVEEAVRTRPVSPQMQEKAESKVEDISADGTDSAAECTERLEPARKVSKEGDGAFEEMNKVKREVEELTARIDQFKGKKKDKEYRYLDEMLTRQLLAMDGIDTHGREDIRQMRKEAVQTINRCLSLLDTRAGAKGTLDAAQATDMVLAELAAQS